MDEPKIENCNSTAVEGELAFVLFGNALEHSTAVSMIIAPAPVNR